MFELKRCATSAFNLAPFRFVRSIYFWLLVWVSLFSTYLWFLHINTESRVADDIAYYSQIFTDLAVGLSCFAAYKVAVEAKIKKFLKRIFISVMIGLNSTELYNLIFHFFDIKTTTPTFNLIWLTPYTIFLVTQIIAWLGLIRTYENRNSLVKNSWFTNFCFVQASVLVQISVLFSNFLKNTLFSLGGAVQIANTVLEICLFFIIAIVLSRSKKRWITTLSGGILIMITFNMTHRFSYVSGYFNKSFDVAWLISFVFAIFGFLYFLSDKEKLADFYDQKSLFVLTSAILLLIASIFFFVYFFLEVFMFHFVESAPLVYLQHLIANIPGILIFSYMIAVFLGKFISVYVLHSMNTISQRVDLIQCGGESDYPGQQNHVISEVQKLDEFITHTVKNLYDANQAKSEFLMNMSHDFRTPVSGISTMSKFIFEKLKDEKTKELQKLVVDSSAQLMEIIDQILGYYQLLHDKKQFSSEKIDIVKLLEDMVSFMSAKVKEKGLSVSVECAYPAVYCVGDSVMLHRVLLNVFSNAIKFTDEGYVKIKVCKADDENKIMVEIADSGIGMESSQLESIFEPFYRVESPFTAKYSGIGLGLSHVKLIVEKLRGSVSIKSTPGTGTVFNLIFPCYE